MSLRDMGRVTLVHLDDATRALVRLAASLAGGDEDAVRAGLHIAHESTPHVWVEELLLQTYLFAGFPRALNGMREWRRKQPLPATPAADRAGDVTALGEATCALVYGSMYEPLRRNIRALHPLLDEWIIDEGYGKVLSRPELDIQRRELCIVASCAATGQDRQLQSHLHGSLNVGVAPEAVSQALSALSDLIAPSYYERATGLWERIRNGVH